jgi:hypothetical protein
VQCGGGGDGDGDGDDGDNDGGATCQRPTPRSEERAGVGKKSMYIMP